MLEKSVVGVGEWDDDSEFLPRSHEPADVQLGT